MRESRWSLAALMAGFGASQVYFAQGPGLTVPFATWGVAGALCASAVLVFLGGGVAYLVALGACVLTVAVAAVRLASHPDRASVSMLYITLAAGVLLSLRVLLARSFARRRSQRLADRAAELREEELASPRAGGPPSSLPPPSSKPE